MLGASAWLISIGPFLWDQRSLRPLVFSDGESAPHPTTAPYIAWPAAFHVIAQRVPVERAMDDL